MKKLYTLVSCLLLFLVNQNLLAQEQFYAIDQVPEIRITFEQADWQDQLNDLYVAGEKERLLASIAIDGTVLDSVGIRYKGFSSVSTNRKKNPFNIKLDYVIDNQQYDGIDKIKLGNVIQDPSFLREVLSYEIAIQYLPSSQANYCKVFINEEYWGVYVNVEAVNKDFTERHYGSRDNAFFKCNPEELDFDGENSNLGNSPGNDTTDYYPFYDIESDAGWTELYELIEVLNERTEEIEEVLNVDRTLWMHAFNYAVINFDSYIGYAQNYYLYKDDQGRFNPILWDMNQSFASYRLTDASEHFDGFSIAQAKTMDPMLHFSSVSVVPRPLLRKLLENDRYRKMYLAHMKTIIEENFANNSYKSRAVTLQNYIVNDVRADSNKFYSFEDFTENLINTVSDLVDYPGITDLMNARTAYLQSYPGYQDAPTISNLANMPATIAAGEDLWLTAEIQDAESVILAYRYGGNGLFQKIEMLDDGTQQDGNANDGVYGIQLNAVGNSVQYYIYAENAKAGVFSPARAAYEYHVLQAQIDSQAIVINELMADNEATKQDEAGEYDDWIELYNTTGFAISTAGMYLSDDTASLKKWALPDVQLGAGEYLMVWADGDEGQGDLHAGFKLSSNGESLLLVDENEQIIDSLTFGEQIADRSWGRIPNGSGPFVEMPPTFGQANSLTVSIDVLEDPGIRLFPNPVSDQLWIEFEQQAPNRIQLHAIDGRLLKTQRLAASTTSTKLSVAALPNGLCYVRLFYDEHISDQKIIIQH